METRIENVEQNGVKAEIATIIHEGREFSAMGSCIDMEGGRISAYIGASITVGDDGRGFLAGTTFRIDTFAGEKIGLATLTSTSRRIYTTWGFHRMEYYTMRYAGFYWHGKKSDDYDLIRFRKGRPDVRYVKLSKPSPGDFLGFPSIIS
jgi:hypothetical protein